MAIVLGIVLVAAGAWMVIAPGSHAFRRGRPWRRWQRDKDGRPSRAYLLLLRAWGAVLVLVGLIIIVVPLLPTE